MQRNSSSIPYLPHFLGIAILAVAVGLGACDSNNNPVVAPQDVEPQSTSVLPAPTELDPDNPQTIDEFLADANSPIEVTLADEVQLDLGGGPITVESLIYDPNTDRWFANIDGTVYTLFGPDPYDSVDGSVTLFSEILDVTEYGDLINLLDENGFSIVYGHIGGKTPVGDIPASGTGSYVGEFAADIDYETTTGNSEGAFLTGDASMTVDFGAAVDQVTLDVSGSGIVFDAGGTVTGVIGAIGICPICVPQFGTVVGDIDLTHAATLDGNTFSGSGTGTYDTNRVNLVFLGTVDDPQDNLDLAGDVAGAFYGPFASEAVGTVVGADTDAGTVADPTATGDYVGGFEVVRDTLVPAP